MLRHLFHIDNSLLLKQKYVSKLLNPYIDYSKKPRLIEAPNGELKSAQKILKNYLYQIEVPDNIFSGIKGRSYVDNARYHTEKGRKNLFKIDLTAFFPSIKRSIVFNFFRNDLKCSSDIARILTNWTTVNLEETGSNNLDEIYGFLNKKGVTSKNHLISGAPTSQILSYLVNHDMFDEMQRVSDNNKITMTVYVDDVTFSSENRISGYFKNKILSIIKKFGYHVSKSKVKMYTKLYPKLITGVIIDSNGGLSIKNSLRYRIINEYKYLRTNPADNNRRKKLMGLLTAARQVDPNAFSTIYRFAFDNSYCECKAISK